MRINLLSFFLFLPLSMCVFFFPSRDWCGLFPNNNNNNTAQTKKKRLFDSFVEGYLRVGTVEPLIKITSSKNKWFVHFHSSSIGNLKIEIYRIERWTSINWHEWRYAYKASLSICVSVSWIHTVFTIRIHTYSKQLSSCLCAWTNLPRFSIIQLHAVILSFCKL